MDGYDDEPSGLGVPPYLDIYARYTAGAVLELYPYCEVLYFTVDEVRADLKFFLKAAAKAQLTVFLAGVCVPGKYLGGEPVRLNELKLWPRMITGTKVLGGPVAKFGFGVEGGKVATLPEELREEFDLIITGDVEAVVHNLLENRLRVDRVDPEAKIEDLHQVREIAIRGARLVKDHPCYGSNLICEIETYRGCPRFLVGGCSFCIEPLYGEPRFRPVNDIAEEVAALHYAGVKHFRLGRQPDLLCYMAKGVGEVEFPKPKPSVLNELFEKIRRAAPTLQTLHIDNVNPGTIAHHPEESKEACKIIVKYHTSGDVAALGIESADPEVVKANNLKVTPDEAMKAIEVINQVGGQRGDNGLPHLLPGVNFVHGLIGERSETYELNLEFMRTVLERGLLVRRINIRQVMVFPGTRMWDVGNRIIKRHKHLFKAYKERMRRTVDLPMIRKVVPKWIVLRRAYIEAYEKPFTYARQPGSYPILICCHDKIPLGRYMDFMVVDHGYRSVTAIPIPLNINNSDITLLKSIPGIGDKKAARLTLHRPFKRLREVEEILGTDIYTRIKEYVVL